MEDIKKIIANLKEQGISLWFEDGNVNDVPFEKAVNYAAVVLESFTRVRGKIPKREPFSEAFVLRKIAEAEKYEYIDYSKIFKLMDIPNVHFHPTTYGIGVEVIFGDITKSIDKISAFLKEKGIEFTTEYSDAHWVYRFKISKSKENLDKVKALIESQENGKKMEEGGEVTKSTIIDIKEQVEQKLQQQQASKQFKDIGRVAHTKKERSAYKLISSQLLSQLEDDAVMAYNMVKKENVWAEIDIQAERDRGVTSGAAYLKVKIREAAPTRPKDAKAMRATYVLFLELLQKDLAECYNVEQIKALRDKYRSLPMNEIIGRFFNPEFLTATEERKKQIEDGLKSLSSGMRMALMYGGSTLVAKLVNEVFGAKFENMLFNKSDAASVNWYEAAEKEPITEEESKELIEKIKTRKANFVAANNEKIEAYKVKTAEELKRAMDTEWQINPDNRKLYKQNIESFRDWVIGFYERRIKIEEPKWEEKEKKAQPKGNDWTWFESPKSKDVTEAQKPKALAINTKAPLAFIKRTGGYKIEVNSPTEIAEKFGFRAVNYGVYVDDKWSKEHTKHFLGSMSDLGEMLNMDIKAINQLGKLSIAFGAKGRKGHAAAYFPQTKDINLTKGNGDGSVAHEWGHYFDNVIVELDAQRATSNFASENTMPDYEIKALFKELMDFYYKGNPLYTPRIPVNFYAQKSEKAPTYSELIDNRWVSKEIEIKPTIEETLAQLDYYAEIRPDMFYTTQLRIFGYVIDAFGLESYSIPCRLRTSYVYHKSAYHYFQYCYKGDKRIEAVADQRTKYWTSAVELFARAWETVILKKLVDRGRVSNYLVDGISLEDIVSEAYYAPYPSGKELEYIETMIDKIVLAVKKKFSIGDFVPPSQIKEDEYIDIAPNKSGKSEAEVVVDKKPDGETLVEFSKEDFKDECVAGQVKVSNSKVSDGVYIQNKDVTVRLFDSALKLKNYVESIDKTKASLHPSLQKLGLDFSVPLWHYDTDGNKLWFEYKEGELCPYTFSTIEQTTKEVGENELGAGIKNNVKMESNIFILPVAELVRLRVQDKETTSASWSQLAEKIEKGYIEEGVNEPLLITYYPNEGKAILADGHHRLEVAEDMYIERMPVQITALYSEAPNNAKDFTPPAEWWKDKKVETPVLESEQKDPKDSAEYAEWREWTDAITTLEMLIDSGGDEKDINEWKDAIETLKMLM